MTEPKKPAAKKAVLKDPVVVAVQRLEAAAVHANQGVVDALDFLRDLLRDDQKNRRFWRWLLIFGLVLNFALLGALGYNAVEGARARAKLVDRSAEQGELLQKVDKTLTIVESVTGPKAQAKQADSLALFLRTVKCDNQRNIDAAMEQLGHPEYELTEDCRG